MLTRQERRGGALLTRGTRQNGDDENESITERDEAITERDEAARRSPGTTQRVGVTATW
jgi:hypothetical protein